MFNSQFTFVYSELWYSSLNNNCQILHVPNQVKQHHQLLNIDSIPLPSVHTI